MPGNVLNYDLRGIIPVIIQINCRCLSSSMPTRLLSDLIAFAQPVIRSHAVRQFARNGTHNTQHWNIERAIKRKWVRSETRGMYTQKPSFAILNAQDQNFHRRLDYARSVWFFKRSSLNVTKLLLVG